MTLTAKLLLRAIFGQGTTSSANMRYGFAYVVDKAFLVYYMPARAYPMPLPPFVLSPYRRRALGALLRRECMKCPMLEIKGWGRLAIRINIGATALAPKASRSESARTRDGSGSAFFGGTNEQPGPVEETGYAKVS